MVEILLVVSLFLWFLALLPVPQLAPIATASGWLAWIVALLITIVLFVPGLR